MTSGSYWRDKSRPIIAAVIATWDSEDEKELNKALYNAYPFGERRMYPYKVWLSEIALQRGRRKTLWKKKEQPNENQISMF